MKTLKILILAISASWLASCAPGITFTKNKIKGSVATSPAEMHYLSQAEMRHAVANLGNNLAKTYGVVNQQYKQLVKYNPDLADSTAIQTAQKKLKFYQQKINLLKPFMTLAIVSLETYGRTFAQPDDDKIQKNLYTNSNSVASNAVGHSSHYSNSSKNLIANIPGTYYKNGHWYMDYDQEGLVPLAQHQAKFISQFPNGVLAQTVKNKYLKLKKTKNKP